MENALERFAALVPWDLCRELVTKDLRKEVEEINQELHCVPQNTLDELKKFIENENIFAAEVFYPDDEEIEECVDQTILVLVSEFLDMLAIAGSWKKAGSTMRLTAQLWPVASPREVLGETEWDCCQWSDWSIPIRKSFYASSLTEVSLDILLSVFAARIAEEVDKSPDGLDISDGVKIYKDAEGYYLAYKPEKEADKHDE